MSALGGTSVDLEHNDPPVSEHTRRLSPREREIVTLLAKGLTGAEMAKQLWLSPETVRTHVRNAMEKLGAKTRTHAVVLALIRGDISLEEQ